MSKQSDARKLFQTDNSAIAQRDRRQYRTFDDMPAGLKQWWADRAKNYAIEGKYGLKSEPVSSNPRTSSDE